MQPKPIVFGAGHSERFPQLFAAFGITGEVFSTGLFISSTTLLSLPVAVAFIPVHLPLFRRYVDSADSKDAELDALGFR
jgi:hypothetical protein